MTTSPLDAEKRALRRELGARRRALPLHERQAAGHALSRVLTGFEPLRRACVICVTLPVRGEVDATDACREWLAEGRTLLLPRVAPDSPTMTLHRFADLEHDVAPGFGGCPEPAPHTSVVSPTKADAILLPGLAYDCSGGRLGQGGGHYDRLLGTFGKHRPLLIGLAYPWQVIDRVPRDPQWDQGVDWVATPEGVVGCGNKAV